MRTMLLLTPLLLLACGGGTDDTALPPVTTDTDPVTSSIPATEVVQFGSPIWSVQGITLFTAPLDPESPGVTQECVLGTNHQYAMGVFGPGMGHDPPYGNEVADGVDRCGYRIDDTFEAVEFSGGQGVWLGVVLVPNPGNVTGSSPDFDDGDVIYNDRFPIVFDVDLRWNDVIADPDQDGFFPPPSDFGLTVNGHSHAVVMLGSALERMPLGAIPEGDYLWDMEIRDETSNVVEESGYSVEVHFRVNEAPTGGTP